ncbi:MAG TPA: cytochrome C oxidase subunit IV family protein [Solimonas sp.]|nr:cytochrome C oxidase subunit IV family protein [Solimonas sp.]
MAFLFRNPLVAVWALLTASTILSWALSRDGGVTPHADIAVTAGVLLIAAVKSQLVIRYFMEVRHAPAWLRRVMNGWLALLFALLAGIYITSL